MEDYKKKYEDALERAKKYYNRELYAECNGSLVEDIFPELKESENEKIRKRIINFLSTPFVKKGISEGALSTWIAWLEKQGEKKPFEFDDTNILNRFSFYSYKDEPNILYLSGLYVNKEQRNKGIGTKILEIADKVAASMECNLIRLKTEIDSNAERLYRKNGYNSLKREGNQVWLEKKCVQESITFNDAHIIDSALNDYCCKKYRAIHKENGGVLSFARLQHLAMDIYGWCKNQDKQNPTDKAEPKFKVKYAENEYNVFEVKDVAGVTFYGIEDEPNHIDYVKADNCEVISGYEIKENGYPYPTKPAVSSEQTPAWSEEDKKNIELLIAILKVNHPNGQFKVNPIDTPGMEAISTKELVNWLKSLKKRMKGE